MSDRYDYERAKSLIAKVERSTEGVIWFFLQRAIFGGTSWDREAVQHLDREFQALSDAEKAAVLRGLKDHANHIVQHAANSMRAIARSKGER